jgi:hypothetical protein
MTLEIMLCLHRWTNNNDKIFVKIKIMRRKIQKGTKILKIAD